MRSIPLVCTALILSVLGCSDATYPFEQVTGAFSFDYTLSEAGQVDVTVLNCYMSDVRSLVSGEQQEAGQHTESWDLLDSSGERIPDGLYYVRISLAGEVVETLMYEVHS